VCCCEGSGGTWLSEKKASTVGIKKQFEKEEGFRRQMGSMTCNFWRCGGAWHGTRGGLWKNTKFLPNGAIKVARGDQLLLFRNCTVLGGTGKGC